jgi:hypothetical protein
MKKTFFLSTVAIISLAIAASPGLGKEKSADTKTTSGNKFDMTGIVKKNAIGICPMEGAQWDLLTNVGQPTHLASGNETVTKMLDQVAGTKKRVRVEGTQVAGVECPHVKVDKVTLTK